MFCEKCGKELAPGSVFCPNCGAKQQEAAAAAEPSEPVKPAAAPVKEQPAPPQTPPSAGSDAAPEHRADESVYRQIISKNADYYLYQFQNIRYSGKNKMNWASFFLGLAHAAYRSVWREWLRAVMWPLIVDAVSALIGCALLGSHPGATLIFVLIAACSGIWWVVANILFAKRFNRIYRAHVDQKIAQRNITPDPSGGRAAAAIVIAAVVSIAANTIVGAAGLGSLLSAYDDDYDYSGDFSASDDAPVEHNDAPADAPDTSGSIIGTDIYDYLGHWTVDMTNSALDASVSFDLESNNDILCFSAEAVWGQGDRATKIGTTSLDMNEAKTQAYGTYCDNLSNTGTVVLDFEGGELYLTITSDANHAWDMTMQHEHCTLDPNGVQEEYADPDLPSYSESGYDYYSDGHTVSCGINDVSSDYIGSNHLWPTDTLTITNSDLSVLTRTEVAEIRNEIFARHGYVYSSSQWSDYFSTADWYYPDSSFSNDMLSSTEKQNVDTITAYEKAQGWNQ